MLLVTKENPLEFLFWSQGKLTWLNDFEYIFGSDSKET